MPILTAGFKTGSTTSILQSLGFKDIKEMDFGSRLVHEKDELFLKVVTSEKIRVY